MQIQASDSTYPAALVACGSPPLTVRGRWPLPDQPSIAVIASAQMPAALLLKTHDVAQEWRKRKLTVVSGFQSSAEAEIWAVLWRDVKRGRGDVHLVKVLARGMLKRISAEQRAAIDAGRLTLLSPFDSKQRQNSKPNAFLRNEVVARLAARLFVPHAHAASSTLNLAARLVQGEAVVETIAHSANHHLTQLLQSR